MIWSKLVEYNFEMLERGTILKFPASFPFEPEVVMMVSEGYSNSEERCLITITGFKAGINAYVTFPSEKTKNGLNRQWLIDNWQNWVWPECDVSEVLVCAQLSYLDLQIN